MAPTKTEFLEEEKREKEKEKKQSLIGTQWVRQISMTVMMFLMILVAGLSSKCRYSKPDFSINGDFHLQDNIESS